MPNVQHMLVPKANKRNAAISKGRRTVTRLLSAAAEAPVCAHLVFPASPVRSSNICGNWTPSFVIFCGVHVVMRSDTVKAKFRAGQKGAPLRLQISPGRDGGAVERRATCAEERKERNDVFAVKPRSFDS